MKLPHRLTLKSKFIFMLLVPVILLTGCDSNRPTLGDDILASSWEVPGGFINVGLCYDAANDTLWVGEYNGKSNGYIHNITKTGREIKKCQISGTPNLQGVAYDLTTDSIWVTQSAYPANNVINVDKNGNVLKTLSIQYEMSAGLAYNDDNDTLFLSPCDLKRTILEIDKDGNIINKIHIGSSFNPSSGLLYADGISYDHDGTLWITQNGDPSIWHIDRQGNVLNSLSNPSGHEAEGIAVDPADNTLWYSADEEYHQSVVHGNRVFHLDKKGNPVNISLQVYDKKIPFLNLE